MNDLISFWKTTKERFDGLEKALIECYIGFLREVAKHYLQRGRRVYFWENRVVHWGEGNLGRLIIEGKEDVDNVFGDYIAEIRFEPEINEEVISGYVEINERNIDHIRYHG